MPRMLLSRLAPKAFLAAGAAMSALIPMAGSMALAQSGQAPDGYTYQAPPPGSNYRQPAPPADGQPPAGDYGQQGNDGPQGYNGQQPYPQQGGYPQQQGGYAPRQQGQQQGDYAPPPEPAPPPGYDGSQPPPPPPGYAPPPDRAQWQATDQRYAADAERWSRDNCVKAHGDAGAGAVIGGILGAVIGGSVAGRHSGGAGILVGGALGAGAGAVVASNADSGATSPGCPPGFVVRRDANQWSAAPAGVLLRGALMVSAVDLRRRRLGLSALSVP